MQKLLQFKTRGILPKNKVKYPQKMCSKTAVFRYSEHCPSLKNSQFSKFYAFALQIEMLSYFNYLHKISVHQFHG